MQNVGDAFDPADDEPFDAPGSAEPEPIPDETESDDDYEELDI